MEKRVTPYRKVSNKRGTKEECQRREQIHVFSEK